MQLQDEVKISSQYISNFKPDLQNPKKDNVKIMMPISIGWEHCEGEQLRAELKLVNEKFKNVTPNSEVIFLTASSLQKFRYQIEGMDEIEALQEAIKKNHIWCETHLPMIEEELTNVKYRFVDWEELKNNSNFLSNLETLNKRYNADQEKKQMLREEKTRRNSDEENNFFTQYGKTGVEFLRSQFAIGDVAHSQPLELCILHTKEECAGQITAISTIKPDYIFYPRPMSAALKLTHKEFIKEYPVEDHYFHIVNREIPRVEKKQKTKNSLPICEEGRSFGGSNNFYKSVDFEATRQKLFSQQEMRLEGGGSRELDQNLIFALPVFTENDMKEVFKGAISALLNINGLQITHQISAITDFSRNFSELLQKKQEFIEINQIEQKQGSIL